MEQPRERLPGLGPNKLLEIKNMVFGLATAPKQWWACSQQYFCQSRVDPCLFILPDAETKPEG
eukprot:11049983-Lingulodinium_polyedra.AAC.1